MPFDKDGNWIPPGGQWLTRDTNTATADPNQQAPAAPNPAPNLAPTPAPNPAPQQQGSSFWSGLGNILGGAENFVKGLFNQPQPPAEQPPLNNAGSVSDSVTNGQSPDGTLPQVPVNIPQGANNAFIQPQNPTLWQTIQNDAGNALNTIEGGMKNFNAFTDTVQNAFASGFGLNKVADAIDPSLQQELSQYQAQHPIGANIAQTIGGFMPYVAGGGLAEGASQLASRGIAQLAPNLADTLAGRAAASAVGQGVMGAGMSAIQEASQDLSGQQNFDQAGGLQGALGRVGSTAGNFALMGAISPTIGQMGRNMVARLLPEAISNGGITNAMRNALIQATGGAVTGAGVAGIDMAIKYLQDPQAFNMSEEGKSALQNGLWMAGMDALSSLLHSATIGRNATPPGEAPVTPKPAGYEDTAIAANGPEANTGGGAGWFVSGTRDMATEGYNQLMPGLWQNPQNLSETVTEMTPHPDDPNWLVPKTKLWLKTRNAGSGNANAAAPNIDVTDPQTQVLQQAAEQPVFGGYLAGETQAEVPPAETAAMGAVQELQNAPVDNTPAVQEFQNAMQQNAPVEAPPAGEQVPTVANMAEGTNVQPQNDQAAQPNGEQPATPAIKTGDNVQLKGDRSYTNYQVTDVNNGVAKLQVPGSNMVIQRPISELLSPDEIAAEETRAAENRAKIESFFSGQATGEQQPTPENQLPAAAVAENTAPAETNVQAPAPAETNLKPGQVAYDLKTGDTTQQVVGDHIAPGIAVRKEGNGWSIDHTPTGLRMGSGHVKKKVIEAAKNYAEIHDWTKVQTPADMKDVPQAVKTYASALKGALNHGRPLPPVPGGLKGKGAVETPTETKPTETTPTASGYEVGDKVALKGSTSQYSIVAKGNGQYRVRSIDGRSEYNVNANTIERKLSPDEVVNPMAESTQASGKGTDKSVGDSRTEAIVKDGKATIRVFSKNQKVLDTTIDLTNYPERAYDRMRFVQNLSDLRQQLEDHYLNDGHELHGESYVERVMESVQRSIDKAIEESKSNSQEVVANGAEPNRAASEGNHATEPAGNVPAASTVGAVEPNARPNSETNAGPVGSNEGTTARAESGSQGSELPASGATPESNSQPGAGVDAGERTVSEQENSTEPGREPAAVSGQSGVRTGQREPAVPRRDFVITNELDNLGGAKTKYKNNVAAIRLLKQIELEDRYATPEEQAVLAKYVGWGGIQDAFDERKVDSKEWGKEIAEMKQLVTDGIISQAEYEAARGSTLNAHYTSPQVIEGIYNALDRMGFGGGRVLEPSMGTGNFFGLMPKDMTAKSERTGVELDPITGRIARQLYQKADVQIKGFEKFNVADNTFDVAVGNVPFGSYGVVDTTYKGQNAFVTSRIHNYFFIKSLDKVRPGGVVAFVTSSGTLNAKDSTKIRELIGKKADFLGAIRLPGDAFKQNAGTEVTTDIIFLQKRAEGEPAKHVDNFTNVVNSDMLSKIDNKPMSNNEYFVKHPEMVLGKYYEDKLHPGRLGVESDGRDMQQALQDAVSKLPSGVYESRTMPPEQVQKAQDEAITDYALLGSLDDGAYAVRNGVVVQRQGDKILPAPVTGDTANRIKGLVGVRDAARKVLADQLQGASDADLKKSQDALNKAYDSFTKKYGILNDPKNLKAFQDDPIGQSVIRALENNVKAVKDGKKTTYTAEKADVFSQRTIQAQSKVDSVENSDEALAVSLFEKGTVDFAHMTALTGKDQATLVNELEGKIFENPAGGWETADQYLSGNVRQKLRDAQAAAEKDPRFQANADALKAIQPTDLTPSEINVKLGATWLDPQDITDFIHEFLNVNNRVKVRYQPILGTWKIDELAGDYNNSLFRNSKNTDEYGVKPKYGRNHSAVNLIEDALNLKQPTITYKDDQDKTIVDVEATNEARAKLKQIQDIFKDWLWENPDRASRLATKYNELFNSVRLREYNGRDIYNKPIPGMAAHWNLRDHQKDVVWRTIQGNNTMIAHEVGFGKTAAVIASSQEMKRLGLINKPMIVVPNNLLAQWEASFRDMYPNAKLLVINSKGIPGVRPPRVQIKDPVTGAKRPLTEQEYAKRLNENRSNRAAALGKIAFGNHDAILITHDTFGKLPMSPEAVQEHIREQLDELEAAIQAAAADEGSKSKTVKQLEDAKKNLQEKIETNLDEQSKDVAIPFEQLGVDQIFVDEAHLFKNLKFHTKMTRVSGLPQTASKRAQDMYLKSQWLTKQRGGRGVVFATGTPISNTVAEMFTMQRYLSMPRLKELGINHFDSWASTFGDTVTGFEQDATGKFKQKTRFSRFQNVAELMTLFRDFSDIKTADMVKLPRPDHIERHEVISDMSAAQKAYLEEMVIRAKAIKSGMVIPEEDNYLKLTTDGRKMAVDVRLVEPTAENDPGSKVNKAIQNIYDVWKDPDIAKDKEGNPVKDHTQLVFLDLGTPKTQTDSSEESSPSSYKKLVTAVRKNNLGEDTGPESQVQDDDEDQQAIGLYDEIRSQLMQKGIPKEQIAFIHEANTDPKREKLFLAVNEGQVRVLIGSTAKMGAGMNVQKKLVALHHIDAPWKPAEVEQREGRIIRQGNDNNRVHIFNYVAKGSFDSIMWDTLKNKAKFIAQVMNGTANVRTMEDVEEMTLGYSHIAAVASGNPLILEKHEVDQKVLELQSLKTAYERTKGKQQSEIAQLPGLIEGDKNKLQGYRNDLQTRQDTKGDNFSIKLGNETLTDRKEAGQKMIDIFNEKYDRLAYNQNEKIGSFAGFDLYIGKPQQFFLQGEGGRYSAEVNSDSPQGTITRLENAPSYIESRIERTEGDIQANTKRLDDLQKLVTRPFEQERELKDAIAKQSDIIKQLSEMDGDNNAVAGTPDEENNADDVLAYIAPRTNRRSGSGSASSKQSNVDPADTKSVVIEDTLKHLTPNAAKTVSDTIAKALGTVIRKGHVKSVAEGQYSLKDKTGAVRGRSMYDWRVVGHELGHAFQDVHKFDGVKSELEDVANALYPDPSKIPAKRKAMEGFAEFFRVWTVDPAHAAKIAPQTTQAFEDFISNDPDLTELFSTVRTIVDNDLAGTPLGRAMGMMAGGKRIASDNIGDEYRVEWWKRPAFNIADFTIPARALTKAAEENGYTGHDLSKIMAIVGSGRSQAEVTFRGRPRDKAGRFITNGRSLQEIAQSGIDHIDKAINYTRTKIPGSSRKQGAAEIFNAIMFANRFAERYDRGFDKLPMTKEDAEWIVQYAKDNFPEAYNDAVEYARTLSQVGLDLLVDADILTPDERERVLQGSDYYIPTIFQESKGFFSSGKSEGGKTNKNPVHRFREGTAPVLNFADATLLHLATVHQAIEMKRVVSTARELLQTEGVGRFGRIIPNPTKVIKVSAQDMMDRINQLLDDPVDVKDVPNQLFNIFTPGGFEMLKNQPVIMDKHNGKMVFMELSPDLAKSILSMQQVPAEGLLRIMGYVSKVERTVGLLNPSYLVGAITRDFTQGIVQSKAPIASFVREWMKAGIVAAGGKMNAKKAKEIMDAYIQSGAHAGVADRVLKDALGTPLRSGLFQTKATGWMKAAKGTKLGFIRVVRTPMEAMRVIEEQPHLAEWMGVWKNEVARLAKETGNDWKPSEMFDTYIKEGTDGLPVQLQDAMEDILVKAAYASRENPLNIAMHGTSKLFRGFSGSVPFMTGGVQGLYRGIRMLSDPKARGNFIIGMALLMGLSLASWAAMNNKMKDFYNNLPSDIRDKYWLFPGVDGFYVAIRKPIEPSLMLNMFERFLDWNGKQTPESRNLFTDWFDAVKSSVDVHMNVAGLSTMINLWANKDTFGNPIVPQSQQTLAKEQQFGPSSSQFGIKVAQLFSQLTADPNAGPSPRQTDFFIKQTFGTFGNIGLQLTDMALGKPSAGTNPLAPVASQIAGALVKDSVTSGSKITDAFYNDYGNAQTLSQSTSKLIQANDGSKPGFVTKDNAMKIHYLPAMTAIDKELAGLRKTYTTAIEQAQTPDQKRTLQAQEDYFTRLGAGLLYGVNPGPPIAAANLNDQQVQAMTDFISKKAQDAMAAASTKTTGPNAEANYMMMLLKDPNQAKQYAIQITKKPPATQQPTP